MLVNGESLRGIAPRIRTLAAREAAVSAAVPPLQVRPPCSAGTERWHATAVPGSLRTMILYGCT
jgi:hypothetical protein